MNDVLCWIGIGVICIIFALAGIACVIMASKYDEIQMITGKNSLERKM